MTKTAKAKANEIATIYKDQDIVAEGVNFICRSCGQFLGKIRKTQVKQHIESKKHKTNFDMKKKHTVTIDAKNPKPYFSDLCRAMIAANIPLFKLENEQFSAFLEKYTKMQTPKRSTLHKNYLENEYDKTMDNIRREIGGNGPIWVSIDETTDVEGRYIANIIVGKMSINKEENKSFLLHCDELPATNSETIAKIFNIAMHKLWLEDAPSKIDRVFLFVSDAAAYMLKAGKALQIICPRMIHVTCAAHGLHRVGETIRSEFPLTNLCISNVKKIFLKAPARIQLFKRMHPDLPLPPEPIITRWGTWIKAAEYYSDHFIEIVEIVRALDDETEAIRTAKETIENANLKIELTSIKTNYSFLAETITKLEASKTRLTESLALVADAQ